MKAKTFFIFLTIFSLLFTFTTSDEDSCPSGMRKTYVDDTNMASFGSARRWLAAVCFFQFPGSLFFYRRMLIEPRFEVHLKAAVDAIDVVENIGEQKIYGYTIVISGSSKNTISGLEGRSVTGGTSSSIKFTDIGYNNFVNALIIEFDFVEDYYDPGANSFSIRYCGTSCSSYDYKAFASYELTNQKYVPGQKNNWDFRFVYAHKTIYLYSGPNTILYSKSYDLEATLGTNIAFVGFTGFMESNRGEINLMGTFMCEDNYVLSKMKGYFYVDDYYYETLSYWPGDTINYSFQFINNQGEVVPHTYGYGIWSYSFFVTQDCDLKGSYTINKYDNYTLILSIPACTTVGKHYIRLNEEKKGAGTLSYYYVEAGPLNKITLVGHDGIIGAVPLKSETETFYLNYGDSNSGDFFIKENLKIILDFLVSDKYGNKVSVSSPNSLFTLKKVNDDGTISNVNSNIISYTLVENGNYYQMTISVAEIGTYLIDKNEYMEKPIKFTVTPGEVTPGNSYCSLVGYSSIPTVSIGTSLFYSCYLRDNNGNEIPIKTFIQNSKYEFVCAVEKSFPSINTYSPTISIEQTLYKCLYKTTELGSFAFNGYLRQKTTKETIVITTKLNQFYVRGDPKEYTIKKILDRSNNKWIDIDTYTNTLITYVPDTYGFITALDFAETKADILISSYVTYPSTFNIQNVQAKLTSTHDETYIKDIIIKYVSMGGRTYIGLYTTDGLTTNNIFKKSSFNYYLKFNYFQVQKSASVKYILNIGSYITCFHNLNEKKTKVNIDNRIELLTGGDEKKLGTIILSTDDSNLYNYDIGTSNIKTSLNPSNNNIIFRLVALSIEGTYDLYVKSNQDYSGKLEIIINSISVKIIEIVSEPSQACYLDWVNQNDFIYKGTIGKEIYYEYNGEFDNGNILVNFILKDRYNNTIEKTDYFTKYSDISSEEYGTDINYFTISFNSEKKRYEFRDNLPYENRQHGWVFTMRESTCNYKYYVRYDGKKGGSPLTKENSYFTLLNTKININNDAFVDVIYKDKNNQLLGLQEGKLEETRSRTKVIALNTEGHSESLTYHSTTSNYALRYKSNFAVSGTYTVKVTLDDNYELKYENTNQLTVIDNIYNLEYSKFKMITSSIIDMYIDVRVTIDNTLYEPIFRLDFYSKDNVKTNYDKNIQFELMLISDNITEDQYIKFNVNKDNDEYIQFTFQENDKKYFKNFYGDFQLRLKDEKSTLLYPIYLTGEGEQDYSIEKDYDISKTEVKPAVINGIAGKTYSINIEFRAKDGLRWNYEVDAEKLQYSYSQKDLTNGDITFKIEKGAKKGQFVIYVTQTKVTTGEANNLSFTYNGDKIPTGVALTIKCAELYRLKLNKGPTDGNVINPPELIFEPKDKYDNLYTDLFTSSITKDELNSLTMGTSKDKVPLTSNNTLRDGTYLVVQYLSTISTDVVVSSDYFEKSYEYRIYSGPINKDISFAEIKSAADQAGGEYVLLISPKDIYNNNIDGLSEKDLKEFTTIYKTIGSNDEIKVENCYLIEKSANNELRSLLTEEQEEKIYTNIECKVNIIKAGNLQFEVKYKQDVIFCKNQCQFIVIPSSMSFTNTLTFYKNKNIYLTLEGPNEIEIGTTPIFELSFYDEYKNQLDENIVNKINVDATLKGTEVKLCVSNEGKIKSVTICPTTNGDDNENKFKYLTNGDYHLYIQNLDNLKILKYPITIKGGSSDGSSDPVDLSKTLLEPDTLNLIAGEEGVVKMTLRTALSQRKNYWYPEPNEKIKIEFDNYGDKCISNVEKGELPGIYLIKVSCTKTIDSNKFSITIEKTTLEQKVQLTINSGLAYYLEVDNLYKYSVSSDKYTWKSNPTNDDVITFSFKFKDQYHNYITKNISETNQFSIVSETYGSDNYYSIGFEEKKYLYTITDQIPFAITKHTWNINIVASSRKYSFIYSKIPGAPDLLQSYWTIDKTSYIIKETSTVTVYLLDRLGVNLGTLEGKLDSEKSLVTVITNKGQDYSYNYNSITTTNIIYTYTYGEIGDYKVSVYYNGLEIGAKKDINVAYQKVDLKTSKLYYNLGDQSDVLMLTTTQTNINNLKTYPFYKFFLYTEEGERITLYDKSLEATCVMTYGSDQWEMVVTKLDEYLNITYTPGFEEKFSKLPLGMYYIQITYDNEILRYPLYLLGEMDVSPSSDYDLGKIYIKPTEIEAIAGEEKEVEIEFRASDGLRWNYEINLLSFGISNSYNLKDNQLTVQKIKGEKNGQMKLKIRQTVSTTDKEDNILTLTYASKTITQTISLKIKSSALKSLLYRSGAEDGTVINPPTLKFLPFDEYGNICTGVFDPIEYPKDKLQTLTKGISLDNYPVTSNIIAEDGYVFVQYGCNKATTIQVTSTYFTETYTYKLLSGPIDSSSTYAQVIKYEGVIAGDITTINIYPKDKYGNDVYSFSDSDISNFVVHYSLGEDISITISKDCKKKEEDTTYITCEANITKSGDVIFGVDYSDKVVECRNCEFNISPDVLDFSKTKVVNQNTNKEMSKTIINTLSISVNPKFILSFFDRFMNEIINQNEIHNLDVKTKIEVTDVKLCVENSNLNKISSLCKSTSNDENEEKWKYITSGNSYQYIVYTQNDELIYPVQITGGYTDGDSGPIDISKTYINPTSIILTAGKEGSISIELRTKDNIRKNYWYENIKNNLDVKFPEIAQDCSHTISKGGKPGQYTFTFICTRQKDSFDSTVVVENTDVPQKISMKVIPSEPARSELYKIEGTKITDQNLGKVSVDDKFQMINKLYDKYDNLITNIDFDLSILKLQIAPSVSVKNYEYNVETAIQKDGEILITLKSTYAGEHIVAGALLPLANYYITFTHGEPSADNSILEVSKKVARVGEIVNIYITPYDKYFNLIDANEYKEISPYQVKYTNEGNTTKVIMEMHSIETVDSINVISYSGEFYIRGFVNFFGYLDTQQIKCVSCRTEIQSGDVEFKNNYAMRYESSKSDYEILIDGAVEKNAKEEPIYRLYPRDQYMNSIDYIPEEKIKTYSAYLESQSEDVTYNLKLNNKEFINQAFAEFVIDDESNSNKYSQLVTGYFNLVFTDGINKLSYNISLLGTGDGGSNEDPDYQMTHINDQNLKFIAGESGYLMLEIRTAKNIRRNGGEYNIQVKSCNENDETFQTTVSKAGLLGVFQVTITTKKANTYPKLEVCPLKIYIDNTLVNKLSPEMEVSPNVIVKTTILEQYYKQNSNTELLDGNADENYIFEVASFDQYDNLAETNQEIIGLKVDYKGGEEVKTTSENQIDTGYRKYTVPATKAGTYVVSTSKSGPQGIYLHNEASFLIIPGEIDLTKTSVKEKTSPIQAGDKPVISIVAYDKYGNMIDYTNYIDKFTATFIDANNQVLSSTPNYDSGVKKVFYTSNTEVTIVGNTKVDVLYNNKDKIDTSKVIIQVYPGEPFPPNSILSREISPGVFAEYLDNNSFNVDPKEVLKLNMTLYDRYKNYVYNLPINAEVKNAKISGNKMQDITFTVLKNTGNFDLDFNGDSKYVNIYQHLVKGTYDLTLTVSSSLGTTDFHYYMIINTGDDLHGNGDYVISKCVLKPTDTTFIAGNYEKFTLELRTEEGLLYNYDIDINKDISIGHVDDSSFKYSITKAGSDFGIYTVTIYSEKKGEYTLNVGLTDPSSGQKKNVNSAKYKVTPDTIPDKTKTIITSKPNSPVKVDSQMRISFYLFDKFNNSIIDEDQIIRTSYFTLLNNDEPYSYITLNFEKNADLYLMPKYPPKQMSLNLLYNNGETTVYIFENNIDFTILSEIDFMKTQIVSSNKERIYAGQELDMWLYTLDQNYKCLDNGDLSSYFEIEIIGPLDSSKQYTRIFGVKKTTLSEEGSSECFNEYQIDNDPKKDPVYKYAGKYLIKVKYSKNNLIAQYNQVCLPLGYSITGFNLQYDFNPDSISILDNPSFTITGTDMYGNKVTDPLYGDIKIAFTYNNNETKFETIKNIEIQKGTLYYEISIHIVGSHQLHIFYKGEEVEKINNFKENLPKFTILTGPCFAEDNTHFDLTPLEDAEVKLKAHFTFQCYDIFDNKITKGGEKFTVKGDYLSTSNQGEIIPLDNAKVVDNGDGSYNVEFVPNMKGTYLFNILAGKEKYGEEVKFVLKEFQCTETNQILCPNKRMCVENIIECIDPPNNCSESTPFNCTVKGKYTCVKSQVYCDCPEGFIKCDIMNYCVPEDRPDMCPYFFERYFYCKEKHLTENYDGVCREEDSGPNQRVCPIGKVLCADLSCRDNYKQCVVTDVQPYDKNRCIGQQLVTLAEECPSSITCESKDEFVCPTGKCVKNELECPSLSNCDEDYPYLCQNNVCAIDFKSCPEAISCGENKLMCPDNICREKC